MFQVEQAVKRAGSGNQLRDEDGKVVARLRELLDEVQAKDQLNEPSSQGYQDYDEDSSQEDMTTAGSTAGAPGVVAEDASSNLHSTPGVNQPQPPPQQQEQPPPNEDSLAIDDAENPLQLLARASYFQPPEEPRKPPQQPAVHPRSHHKRISSSTKSQEAKDLQRFFASAARVKLDVGDDVDPISLGLATIEEGEGLFSL